MQDSIVSPCKGINKQVKILARISKAGNAMLQAGDLLGVADQVNVGKTKTIDVIISK